MATFDIELVEGNCSECKQKTYITPIGLCLGCAVKLMTKR